MAGGAGSLGEMSSDKSSPSKKSKRLRSAFLDEKRGKWRCRNCGWVYPVPNPDRRQRREHKKHCVETLKVQQWLAVFRRRVPVEHEKVESRDDFNAREASTFLKTWDTAVECPLLQLDDCEKMSKHSTRSLEIEHEGERGYEIEHESERGTEIEHQNKRNLVIDEARDGRSKGSRTTSSVEGEKKILTRRDGANLVGGKDESPQVVDKESKGLVRHSLDSQSNKDSGREIRIQDVEDESIVQRDGVNLAKAKAEVLQVVVGRFEDSRIISTVEGEKNIPTCRDRANLVEGNNESPQVVGRESKGRGQHLPDSHSNKNSDRKSGIQDVEDEFIVQKDGVNLMKAKDVLQLAGKSEGLRTTSAVEGEKKIPTRRDGANLVGGKDESPQVVGVESKARGRHSRDSHSNKDPGSEIGIQHVEDESIFQREGLDLVKAKNEVLQVVDRSEDSRTIFVVEGEKQIPTCRDRANLVGGNNERPQVVGRESKGQGRHSPDSPFNKDSGRKNVIQDVKDESTVRGEGVDLVQARDEVLEVVGRSEGSRTTFVVEGEKQIPTRWDGAYLVGGKAESRQVVGTETKGRGRYSADSHFNKDSGKEIGIQDIEEKFIIQKEGVNLVKAKNEVLQMVGRPEGSRTTFAVEGKTKIPTRTDGANLMGGKDESAQVVGRESKGRGRQSADSQSNKDSSRETGMQDVEDESIVQREGVNLVKPKDEFLQVVGRSESLRTTSAAEGEKKIPTCRDGANLVGRKYESLQVVGRVTKDRGSHSPDSYSNKNSGMKTGIEDEEDESIVQREGEDFVKAKDEVLQIVGRSKGLETTPAIEGETDIPTRRDGANLVGGKDEVLQLVGPGWKAQLSHGKSSEKIRKEIEIKGVVDLISKEKVFENLSETKDETAQVMGIRGRGREPSEEKKIGVQDVEDEITEVMNLLETKDEIRQVVGSDEEGEHDREPSEELQTGIQHVEDVITEGINLSQKKDEKAEVVDRVGGGHDRMPSEEKVTGISRPEGMRTDGMSFLITKEETAQAVGSEGGDRERESSEEKETWNAYMVDVRTEGMNFSETKDETTQVVGSHVGDHERESDQQKETEIPHVEDVTTEGMNLSETRDETAHAVGNCGGGYGRESSEEMETGIPHAEDLTTGGINLLETIDGTAKMVSSDGEHHERESTEEKETGSPQVKDVGIKSEGEYQIGVGKTETSGEIGGSSTRGLYGESQDRTDQLDPSRSIEVDNDGAIEAIKDIDANIGLEREGRNGARVDDRGIDKTMLQSEVGKVNMDIGTAVASMLGKAVEYGRPGPRAHSRKHPGKELEHVGGSGEETEAKAGYNITGTSQYENHLIETLTSAERNWAYWEEVVRNKSMLREDRQIERFSSAEKNWAYWEEVVRSESMLREDRQIERFSSAEKNWAYWEEVVRSESMLKNDRRSSLQKTAGDGCDSVPLLDHLVKGGNLIAPVQERGVASKAEHAGEHQSGIGTPGFASNNLEHASADSKAVANLTSSSLDDHVSAKDRQEKAINGSNSSGQAEATKSQDIQVPGMKSYTELKNLQDSEQEGRNAAQNMSVSPQQNANQTKKALLKLSSAEANWDWEDMMKSGYVLTSQGRSSLSLEKIDDTQLAFSGDDQTSKHKLQYLGQVGQGSGQVKISAMVEHEQVVEHQVMTEVEFLTYDSMVSSVTLPLKAAEDLDAEELKGPKHEKCCEVTSMPPYISTIASYALTRKEDGERAKNQEMDIEASGREDAEETHSIAVPSHHETGQESIVLAKLSLVGRNWDDCEVVAASNLTTGKEDGKAVESERPKKNDIDIKASGRKDGVEMHATAVPSQHETGQASRLFPKLPSAERNWEGWEIVAASHSVKGKEREEPVELQGPKHPEINMEALDVEDGEGMNCTAVPSQHERGQASRLSSKLTSAEMNWEGWEAVAASHVIKGNEDQEPVELQGPKHNELNIEALGGEDWEGIHITAVLSQHKTDQARKLLPKLSSAERNWEGWEAVAASHVIRGHEGQEPVEPPGPKHQEINIEALDGEDGEGMHSTVVPSNQETGQASRLLPKLSSGEMNWKGWDAVTAPHLIKRKVNEEPVEPQRPKDHEITIEALGREVGRRMHSTTVPSHHETREANRMLVKLSWAERNWEDWEDVIRIENFLLEGQISLSFRSDAASSAFLRDVRQCSPAPSEGLDKVVAESQGDDFTGKPKTDELLEPKAVFEHQTETEVAKSTGYESSAFLRDGFKRSPAPEKGLDQVAHSQQLEAEGVVEHQTGTEVAESTGDESSGFLRDGYKRSPAAAKGLDQVAYSQQLEPEGVVEHQTGTDFTDSTGDECSAFLRDGHKRSRAPAKGLDQVAQSQQLEPEGVVEHQTGTEFTDSTGDESSAFLRAGHKRSPAPANGLDQVAQSQQLELEGVVEYQTGTEVADSTGDESSAFPRDGHKRSPTPPKGLDQVTHSLQLEPEGVVEHQTGTEVAESTGDESSVFLRDGHKRSPAPAKGLDQVACSQQLEPEGVVEHQTGTEVAESTGDESSGFLSDGHKRSPAKVLDQVACSQQLELEGVVDHQTRTEVAESTGDESSAFRRDGHKMSPAPAKGLDQVAHRQQLEPEGVVEHQTGTVVAESTGDESSVFLRDGHKRSPAPAKGLDQVAYSQQLEPEGVVEHQTGTEVAESTGDESSGFLSDGHKRSPAPAKGLDQVAYSQQLEPEGVVEHQTGTEVAESTGDESSAFRRDGHKRSPAPAKGLDQVAHRQQLEPEGVVEHQTGTEVAESTGDESSVFLRDGHKRSPAPAKGLDQVAYSQQLEPEGVVERQTGTEVAESTGDESSAFRRDGHKRSPAPAKGLDQVAHRQQLEPEGVVEHQTGTEVAEGTGDESSVFLRDGHKRSPAPAKGLDQVAYSQQLEPEGVVERQTGTEVAESTGDESSGFLRDGHKRSPAPAKGLDQVAYSQQLEPEGVVEHQTGTEVAESTGDESSGFLSDGHKRSPAKVLDQVACSQQLELEGVVDHQTRTEVAESTGDESSAFRRDGHKMSPAPAKGLDQVAHRQQLEPEGVVERQTGTEVAESTGDESSAFRRDGHKRSPAPAKGLDQVAHRQQLEPEGVVEHQTGTEVAESTGDESSVFLRDGHKRSPAPAKGLDQVAYSQQLEPEGVVERQTGTEVAESTGDESSGFLRDGHKRSPAPAKGLDQVAYSQQLEPEGVVEHQTGTEVADSTGDGSPAFLRDGHKRSPAPVKCLDQVAYSQQLEPEGVVEHQTGSEGGQSTGDESLAFLRDGHTRSPGPAKDLDQVAYSQNDVIAGKEETDALLQPVREGVVKHGTGTEAVDSTSDDRTGKRKTDEMLNREGNVDHQTEIEDCAEDARDGTTGKVKTGAEEDVEHQTGIEARNLSADSTKRASKKGSGEFWSSPAKDKVRTGKYPVQKELMYRGTAVSLTSSILVPPPPPQTTLFENVRLRKEGSVQEKGKTVVQGTAVTSGDDRIQGKVATTEGEERNWTDWEDVVTGGYMLGQSRRSPSFRKTDARSSFPSLGAYHQTPEGHPGLEGVKIGVPSGHVQEKTETVFQSQEHPGWFAAALVAGRSAEGKVVEVSSFSVGDGYFRTANVEFPDNLHTAEQPSSNMAYEKLVPVPLSPGSSLAEVLVNPTTVQPHQHPSWEVLTRAEYIPIGDGESATVRKLDFARGSPSFRNMEKQGARSEKTDERSPLLSRERTPSSRGWVTKAKLDFEETTPERASPVVSPNSYHDCRRDGKDVLQEVTPSSPSPSEYDVERVLREQTNYDLICPFCGSLITRRIIMRTKIRRFTTQRVAALRTSSEISPTSLILTRIGSCDLRNSE